MVRGTGFEPVAPTVSKYGHIQIGCNCQKFEWWTTPEAEKFARENGYTDAQIEEYRSYIELFLKVGKKAAEEKAK